MSSWEHCCELDVRTLNLLFERQVASLRVLYCNRYSSSCNVSARVVGGIRELTVESMNRYIGSCRWAARMIIENAKTLNHLDLGFATSIAHLIACNRRPRYDKMSRSFAVELKKTLSDCGLEPLIHLSLETLNLCGLDIGEIRRGNMALDIDFDKITDLRLESCPGLSRAFSLLMGQEGSSKPTLGALQCLFVRVEDPESDFSTSLESFLTSLGGLNTLKVLIDNASAAQNLESILEVHGKTLNTLVWDERFGPRQSLDDSRSMAWANCKNLRTICLNCPSLEILGISLDWKAICSPHEVFHENVIRCPLHLI